MLEHEPPIDWRDWQQADRDTVSAVDGRRRLRRVGVLLVVILAAVYGRLIALEASQGSQYRAEAAKPIVRRHSLPALRGRILARDGTVLAYDRHVPAVAVHYRYLERPPNPRWLWATARARLTPHERRDPQRVANEEARLREELDELELRLAALCELSPEVWRRRCEAIQVRVERIARRVNEAHHEISQATPAETSPPLSSAWCRQAIRSLLVPREPSTSTPRITVAEELDDHVVVPHVALDVAAEIEAQPGRYPGVRIVTQFERTYPAGSLAAHVVGHLGPVDADELSANQQDEGHETYHPDDRVGRVGAERSYESVLRGRRGLLIEYADHSGQITRSVRQREPESGRDVVLSIDPALERSAESLLASALVRRGSDAQGGGAIVVMDVERGELLAAASAPQFDPNLFGGSDAAAIHALLNDPHQPLFNRVAQMAIAPGSVYKTVAAIALLERRAIDPLEHFHCHGFLHSPDRQRCLIYKEQGIGHGDVTLVDALAQSCNVYFFHAAGELGPAPLVDWSLRLGFGRPTGCDLPHEAAGMVPTPANIQEIEGHAWRVGDSQALAIGQGSLTVTPLQVARLMAAVANGGTLVTPHVVRDVRRLEGWTAEEAVAESVGQRAEAWDIAPPEPIEGLRPETLEILRRGLVEVVESPQGTGHDTVRIKSLPIAGKTGTAETGPARDGTPRDDHAWFAGFAPADAPKVAIVVALEHAGSGSLAAGPVVNRLVARMDQLGYFKRRGRTPTGHAGSERRDTATGREVSADGSPQSIVVE